MYRKNTAGQFVCFQMLLTATGAAATGLSPAVRRCIDGTFAAGGGTVTEDTGTGSYKYAMAQADTNGNDISLIFSVATAIPVCVNFVTTAADPTDGVRFGLTAIPNATAGATNGLPLSVDSSGRVDVLKINGTSQTARDIGASVLLASGQKVDVDTIKTNPVVNAGTITFPTGATLASTTNITAGTITTVTNLTNAPTAGDLTATMKTSVTTAATAATPTIAGYTGNTPQTGDAYALLGAPAGASVSADVAAINSKTTNLPGSPAAVGSAMTLTSGERTSIADAMLDRDMSVGADSGSTTVRTVRQALRFLRNKWAVATGTLTVYKEDDATSSWTATVSTDVAAVPIVGNDPTGP